MKNIQFTYNNGKGKVTDRDVVVISEARDFIEAIDLTDCTPEEKSTMVQELEDAHRRFLDELKELGIINHWRRFKSAGMSQVKNV